MKLIDINLRNLESEHICCSIGNDELSQTRSASKKAWLRERMRKDSLVFRRFDARGKMFVEYMPIERVWKPLRGKNYLVINCLWVSGRFKGDGLGAQLLESCLEDARAQNAAGVAVVTSPKARPFLTDGRFYKHSGFEVVDQAAPYFELLVHSFARSSAASQAQGTSTPRFTERARAGTGGNDQGLTLIYAEQCPFMHDLVPQLGEIARERGLACEVRHLKSGREARAHGSPFGTLGVYWNGRFQTHELMTPAKFAGWLNRLPD